MFHLKRVSLWDPGFFVDRVPRDGCVVHTEVFFFWFHMLGEKPMELVVDAFSGCKLELDRMVRRRINT